MPIQVHISLSLEALRRGLDLTEASGFESLDRLVEGLLLDSRPSRPREESISVGEPQKIMISVPDHAPLELAESIKSPQGRLAFLTNRFGPIKVSTRTLAGFAARGAWPTTREFQLRAAGIAREIGLQLRTQDEKAGRRGPSR